MLYPLDWSADAVDTAGEYLHDFSYAGYHGGEEPPRGRRPDRTFDVTVFGAAADDGSDATSGFQAAIDAAADAGGGVVFVPAGEYTLEGQLRVTTSGTVIRGAGPENSRLVFPSAMASHRAHITFAGVSTEDLTVPLAADGQALSLVVEVEDASELRVADDIVIGWTITPDFVEAHRMVDVWGPFNDRWQSFFRREVVAVDTESSPHRVTLDVPLRYPALVRDGAELRRVGGLLRESGFESIAVSNSVGWDVAWSESQVAVVDFLNVEDCWVRDVSSFVSPAAPLDGPGSGAHLRSSGIRITGAKRMTVSETHLGESQNRGPGGNGYLFEVRQSSEVLTRDSSGQGGRHNFIQNWGFGTTGCVWLRVHSSEGRALTGQDGFSSRGLCDFHHSLSTANLVDASTLEDGWSAENRGTYSSGAGHSATQNVAWNTTGGGALRWYNYGRGYVIGTGPDLVVATQIVLPNSAGTEPEDSVEGAGLGEWLEPQSLYEDQRAQRLGTAEP